MGAFRFPLVCLKQAILPLPLSPTHPQFFEQPLTPGVVRNIWLFDLVSWHSRKFKDKMARKLLTRSGEDAALPFGG